MNTAGDRIDTSIGIAVMYKHILIATDGSDHSDAALLAGARLAKVLGADVTIVTAVQIPEPNMLEGEIVGPDFRDRQEEAQLDADEILSSAFKIISDVGVKAKSQSVLDQPPYQAIVGTAEANGCDLIIMASHGRSGVSALLLGSETQKVLTHSSIPVLVYRR